MTNPSGASPSPGATKKRAPRKRTELRSYLETAGDFPAVMREVIQDVRAASSEAVAANSESAKGHEELVARIASAIEKELEKPDLSPEDRIALIDKMMELAERAGVKDSENKRFLFAVTQDRFRAGMFLGGAALVVAVAAVAGPDGLKQLAKELPRAAGEALTQ